MMIIIMISFSVGSLAVDKQDIVNKIIETYDSQWQGIRDITIITDKATTYKKRIEDTAQWKMRQETEVNGMKFTTIYDGKNLWQDNPMSGKREKVEVNFNPHDPFYGLLKDNKLEYKKKEEISGKEYYVFVIVEQAAEEIFNIKNMQNMGDINVSGRIWVDMNNYNLKRMELVVDYGGSASFKQVIDNEDFHQIEGMWVPYCTTITMSNMKEVINIKEVKVNQALPDSLFTEEE